MFENMQLGAIAFLGDIMNISKMNFGERDLSRKESWHRLFFACFFVVICMVSTPGRADVSAPPASSAQPSVTLIPLGQATSMNVTWLVTSFPVPATTYTVFSSSGQFVLPLSGQVLATVNTVISRVVTAAVAGPAVTTIITETVLVPQEVSVLATRAGETQFVYRRTFSDGSVTTAVIPANVRVGGSGAGRFNVSRIALTFEDGAVVRIVPVKSQLSGVAELTLVGGGFLRGDWEVADPGSTSGTPFFRGLQTISQGFGGADRVKLKSPKLPTEISGLHMLRLRVTDPLPGFDPPVLYYYVGEPKPGTTLSFMPMTVMNPPSQAYIDSATQFVWQPVKDARAYKIEIFANPENASNNLPDLGGAPVVEDRQQVRRATSHSPVAGMMIAGTKTQTTLSESTRAKLQKQHSYFWRIQAIGLDGMVVGEAQVRELRVP